MMLQRVENLEMALEDYKAILKLEPKSVPGISHPCVFSESILGVAVSSISKSLLKPVRI